MPSNSQSGDGVLFGRAKSLVKRLAWDGVVNLGAGLLGGTVVTLGLVVVEFAKTGGVSWAGVQSGWIALVIAISLIAGILRGIVKAEREMDGF